MIKSINQIVLAAVSALIALPAAADITSTGKTLPDYPRFLNQKFCSNDDVRLYIEGERDEDTGIRHYSIIDDQFSIIKTINTPAYPIVSATFTVRQSLNGPIDITASYIYDEKIFPSISKEDFISHCENDGYSIIQEADGELRMLSANEWEYYYPDSYGKKYPTRYRYWKDGEGYMRTVEYSYGNWGPTGGYGQPSVEEHNYISSPISIDPKSPDCVDMDDFTLSQTLFNNDDLYEWIIPTFEAVDCNYQTEYEIIEGQQVKAVGFKVQSENGATVADVRFPAGLYCYHNPDIRLYMINDKNYLGIEVSDISSREYYYITYEVNAQNASVNMIDAPRRISVHPTTPRRGTDIHIDLGQPAGEHSTLTVTSLSGRNIVSRNIEPGTTSTTIDTGRLEQGMYIVTVSDGNSSRETTKIVIR